MRKDVMINLDASIFENTDSWENFKYKIEKYYNADYSEIGRKYEIFAKYYFMLESECREDYKSVWLYNEIPTNIRDSLNLTKIEHGIDLLLEDHDNNFYAVQCKYRANEDSKLSWSKDKIANLFGYSNKIENYIVFSNASDLDDVSQTRTSKFQFISIADMLKLEDTFFKDVHIYIKENKRINLSIKYKPREHQEKAITSALQHYLKNDRGQLILPCGAGKTLTSLWIKEALNGNDCLVLLPSLALLKQIKSDWKKQSNSHFDYICVCSDDDIDKADNDTTNIKLYDVDIKVTTNPDEINCFLGKNKKKVIFSTYQSVDIVIPNSFYP